MTARIVLFLATLAVTGVALAEKPVVKPYAAGAPFGGIPFWSPGDKFVAISSGKCDGTCPVYELYLFDDGRVVYSGRKDTRKRSINERMVGRSK